MNNRKTAHNKKTMHHLNEIPFFKKLENSKNILLAGAGGGFDIFSGIPVYLNLRKQGKNVILANFSFTWLDQTTAEKVTSHCYKIKGKDEDLSGRNYFPEKYLSIWLNHISSPTDVYAFDRTGVLPLKEAYNYLIEKHDIDTIVLVDGGTDSLMFGDEEGLGTPQEDIASMAAVYQAKKVQKYLICIGFGIDHFHGVCHYRFLENVAEIASEHGYLGLFQLIKDMEESEAYASLIKFSNEAMRGKESIVSNSILSALEGKYGNHQSSDRTKGSALWINPLMTIYWCFELDAVVRKIKYYDLIKDSKTMGQFNIGLAEYRDGLKEIRKKQRIPI